MEVTEAQLKTVYKLAYAEEGALGFQDVTFRKDGDNLILVLRAKGFDGTDIGSKEAWHDFEVKIIIKPNGKWSE